jgi:hypothetical protein
MSVTSSNGAGCVPGDVGQRFLRAAVESKADICRQRARAALDPQGHVGARVGPEARDQRLELRDVRQLLAAKRADGLASVR